MILGKTNIVFGLTILVLGIWLVSRYTSSQYSIVGIAVILWLIMSMLKLMAMRRLDFLQSICLNFIIRKK